jgi:hypothetical protein
LQQQENDGDIVGTSVKYHIDLPLMVVLIYSHDQNRDGEAQFAL